MRIFAPLFVAAVVLGAPAAAEEAPRGDGILVDSIDPAIDPCEDFYQYACHGWLKRNPIPTDQSSWDVGAPLVERNDSILRGILERAAAGSDPATKRLGDYWTACMDKAVIEAKGLDPLRDELDRIARLDDRGDLPGLIAHLHRVAVGALFALSSGQDYRDATQVTAEIDQGGLGLPVRDYYLTDDAKSKKIRAAYVAHLAAMDEMASRDLGTIVKPEVARARARSVLAFETQLAQASETDDQRVDPHALYHPIALATLRHAYRRFGWMAYLGALGLQDVKQINLAAPHYLERMGGIVAAAPLAQIRAYLTALLLDRAADLLPDRFASESFAFFGGVLRGAREQRPRWKRCVGLADADLGDELGRAYIALTFNADSKTVILDLVNRVRAVFRENLETIPWMSPRTRKRAQAKLDQMVVKIGYPDHWRDDAALEIKRDEALGNTLRAAEFEFARDLSHIGKPVDRTEWSITPSTVNAYYDDQKNDITFPAGTLQPPYFDRNWDDAVNYGAIGATIGHEMTHGFDDSGRMFDANGNMRDWWTASDATAFEARAQCFVDEYSGFSVGDDATLNGRTTLGENTADNGGTRLAYLALERKLAGQTPSPIDGYSAEQRFFIAYAQSFCENQTPQSAALQALADPHSTAQYRVNGVVRNMPEFHKIFMCRPDQRLVPARICRVW